MKSFKWICFLTLVSCFFHVGCGGGSTAPVGTGSELEAYVAANPDSGEDLDAEVEADVTE